MKVLQHGKADWIHKNFDLCPLCDSGLPKTRAGSDTSTRTVFVNLNLKNYMEFDDGELTAPGCEIRNDDMGRPCLVTYRTDDPGFSFDMTQIGFRHFPSFTYDGNQMSYELLGYSTSPHATSSTYSTSREITASDFPDGESVLVLYAVWGIKCLVKFAPGTAGANAGSMFPMVVERGIPSRLPPCTFEYDDESPLFCYHGSDKWSNDYTQLNNPSQNPDNRYVQTRRFAGWKYSLNGAVVEVPDGGSVIITDMADD